MVDSAQSAAASEDNRDVNRRWKGLDDIPTPTVARRPDASGRMQPDAPRQSREHGIASCDDLTSSKQIKLDPKEFIQKRKAEEAEPKYSYLNQRWFLVTLSVVLLAGLLYLAYWQLTAAEQSRCLKKGYDDLLAQHFSDAIATFNECTSRDPRCAQAYYYRAIALAQSGEEKKSAADFERCITLGITATNVKLARAGIEAKRENWTKALEILNELTVDGERDLEVLRLRAMCHTKLNDFPNAVKDCTAALDVCTNDSDRIAVKADRAFAELKMNDIAAGMADFAEPLRAKPNSAIYMICGDALRKDKRWAEALQQYCRALMLQPDNYDACVSAGICEVALGKHDEALLHFNRAVGLRKNGVEALIQRGSLYLVLGSYNKARIDLRDACDLNPNIPEIEKTLRTAERHLGASMSPHIVAAPDKHEEITTLPASTQKMPSNLDELVYVGRQFLGGGDFRAAIAYLTQAVRQAPNRPDARRYLAQAFSGAGLATAAVTQFEALASLQPLNDGDVLAFAKDLQLSGKSAGAVKILSDRLTENPRSVELRLALANIYFRAGQLRNGAVVCRQGLQCASPSDRQLLMHMLEHPPDPDPGK